MWMAVTMSRSALVILGIYTYSTVADMSYLTLIQRSKYCLNLNRWMRIEGVLMCWDAVLLWCIFAAIWSSYTSNPFFTGTHEATEDDEDLSSPSSSSSSYESGGGGSELLAIRSWGVIAPFGAICMAMIGTLFAAIEVREGLRSRKVGDYDSATTSSPICNNILRSLHDCLIVIPTRMLGLGEGRQLDQTDAYRSCQRFLPVTKMKLFIHLLMFILCMMFLGPVVSDVETSRDSQDVYG